jgi:hypothetical protein
MGPVSSAAVDVVAMDGLGVIGTVGFFVPAALLIALVVGAVVRDRRLHAREERSAQDPSAQDPSAQHLAANDPRPAGATEGPRAD